MTRRRTALDGATKFETGAGRPAAQAPPPAQLAEKKNPALAELRAREAAMRRPDVPQPRWWKPWSWLGARRYAEAADAALLDFAAEHLGARRPD
jgi:hypothetical protein